MAKTNITTLPGQVSDLQQQAAVQLPTQETVQQPAQEQGGWESLLEGTSAAPSAPPADTSIQEGIELGLQEQERSMVPSITERSKQQVTPVKWDQRRGAPPVTSDDGGIAYRATNLAEAFKTNEAWGTGLGLKVGALSDTVGKIGAVTSQEKVQKPDGSLGFSTEVDPAFLQIGSAVTENIITRLAQGQAAVVDFQQEKRDTEDREPAKKAKGEVTKTQSNAEIGKEINREYQRVKNQRAGQPTDQYQELGQDEAALLGDAFKEMYAIANPDILKRVAPNENSSQVTFQLTPEGETRLNSPEAKLKRSVMFPGVNVRPSKLPISGQLKSEVGKVATRKATGHVKGTPAGQEVIEEAKRNMSEVPNVVNVQRMKILFSTVLPVLRGDQDALPAYAEINNIGRSAIDKFAAEQKKADREGVEYDQVLNYEQLQNSVAQSVRAVAMERKGANYLSYYTQNFNGRIAPQQSFFDPTSSKAVRFVTTNAVPARATPGSRVEHNLRQMYAMMLVKGADALLPDGRETALEAATPKLVAWGKRLQEVLANSMTDAEAEAIANAIEQGMSLTDPNFPQFQQLQLDPSVDGDLLAEIEKKGEDGPHFIDGLIDFANYHDAKQKGKPYHSFFNAYMDGKTNGIASNGIQMGSRPIALKTGVLRTNDKQLLDEGVDVRDFLMNQLKEQLEISGLQTSDPNMYTVAKALYGYRQLAKDTTMTFGYGKELESFSNDIDGALDLLAEQDPDVAAAMEAMLAGSGDRESIVESLWTNYTNHLGGALSEEALAARPLMRAAATYFGLMDRPLNIKTATGFELNLGGEIAEGEIDTEQSYTIYEQGKKREVHATTYKTRSSGIAAKGDQGIGSRTYGGSLPGPVQSIDAATVAMTASGKSWDKLKAASNGKPYLHTIYDAFKVDAMGYDVVLEETNKNWLDAGMEWSYLQATQDSLKENIAAWNKEMAQLSDARSVLAGPTDQFAMFGHLTEITESQSGKMGPWNLAKRLTKIRQRPENMNGSDFFFENLAMAKDMMAQLNANGFNHANPKAGDVKMFMKMFEQATDLNRRLDGMIKHTNNNKKKLKEEIKRSGVPVYQYYAH